VCHVRHRSREEPRENDVQPGTRVPEEHQVCPFLRKHPTNHRKVDAGDDQTAFYETTRNTYQYLQENPRTVRATQREKEEFLELLVHPLQTM